MGKYVVPLPFVLVFTVTMIIFSVLALAVIADGYRLHNQSSSTVRNNLLSLMCEQNGVNSNDLEIARVNYLECMEDKFEMKKFETEFTEAQYNDSYNELFEKYCAKTPQLKICYHALMDAVSPCIGNTSELLISTTKNTMNQILDFLCEDDGAVISRFSSEGGPQCLQSKIKDIIGCAVNFQSPTLNKDINITTTEANNSRIYHESLTCVLKNLETCNNSISAKVFKKIADTIHQSVSEVIRQLSENITTQQMLEQINGTENVAVKSVDRDTTFERQCGEDGVNCTEVQIRELFENVTTKQMLEQINGTLNVAVKSVDRDTTFERQCGEDGVNCTEVQIRELFENVTTKQMLEQINGTLNVAVKSVDRDTTFERQCGEDEVNCTAVQIQNSSDNVTTNQVLDHANDTQHEPDRSDEENKLYELCKKNGADFEALQDIGKHSVACMEDSFGIKIFDRDLKEAQNTTSYADVFKRHCPKAPLLKTCVHTLIYGVSLCFGDEAEDYRRTTTTAYDGIIDYVCQDDGFRIAKFLAEGGVQCLKNKSRDIMRCAKDSKNSFLQEQEITLLVTQIYHIEDRLLDCIFKSVASCDPAIVETIESVGAVIRNSYFHDSKKKIPEKRTKSLVKASGTMVLAFKVDIFV